MWSRLLAPLALAGTLALTVVLRIPAVLSTGELSFDEGVYGASVMAMRGGAAPFRDIFSSQGPLFLPLLWLFDVIGLRNVRAIRLGMVVAALAVTFGTYLLARRVGSRGVAVVGALVTGTSAALLAAAGPVQSDGLALAFAVWAVVVAMEEGDRLGRARPLVVGVLIGAAVALKSVFAAPAGLAIAWLYLARRHRRQLAVATAAGVLLVLAASLPWGLGNVWEQFVSFHLGAPRNRNPLRSLHRLGEAVWTEEAPVLAFAAAGLVTAVVARRRTVSWLRERRVDCMALVIWLAATMAMLLVVVGFSRGFWRFAAFAIPPLVALVAMVRPPVWLALVAVLGAAPVYYMANDKEIWRQDLTSTHEEVVGVLRAMPEGAEVVTDRPGLAWAAERHPPPPLVDPSWARIRSRDLVAADILEAVDRPDVCAVLFYTKRFDFMDRRMDEKLDGYSLYEDWGEGRRLYLRDGCAGQPRAAAGRDS